MLSIEQLREQIQDRDRDIIRSLALRQDLCKKIALLKKKAGKQVIDVAQEKKNFAFYESLSKECALDPEFIACLFRLIIINSRTLQQKICQFESVRPQTEK